jgi:hypothetical protein
MLCLKEEDKCQRSKFVSEFFIRMPNFAGDTGNVEYANKFWQIYSCDSRIDLEKLLDSILQIEENSYYTFRNIMLISVLISTK